MTKPIRNLAKVHFRNKWLNLFILLCMCILMLSCQSSRKAQHRNQRNKSKDCDCPSFTQFKVDKVYDNKGKEFNREKFSLFIA
jgi:hypothetical protein